MHEAKFHSSLIWLYNWSNKRNKIEERAQLNWQNKNHTQKFVETANLELVKSNVKQETGDYMKRTDDTTTIELATIKYRSSTERIGTKRIEENATTEAAEAYYT